MDSQLEHKDFFWLPVLVSWGLHSLYLQVRPAQWKTSFILPQNLWSTLPPCDMNPPFQQLAALLRFLNFTIPTLGNPSAEQQKENKPFWIRYVKNPRLYPPSPNRSPWWLRLCWLLWDFFFGLASAHLHHCQTLCGTWPQLSHERKVYFLVRNFHSLIISYRSQRQNHGNCRCAQPKYEYILQTPLDRVQIHQTLKQTLEKNPTGTEKAKNVTTKSWLLDTSKKTFFLHEASFF